MGFGERAQELKIEDVPALTIDYNYGTNLQHALALSRHLLRNERGERQVVVVTDGEPTAHLTSTGEPFFAWPPVRETLERTMAEVLRCTKAGITINTFALDIERSQFPFVEQIARVNGGRLFYTGRERSGNVRPRRLRQAPPSGLDPNPPHQEGSKINLQSPPNTATMTPL